MRGYGGGYNFSLGNSDGGTVFNIKDFGAVSDGVTDDTAAIQLALDAAKANAGGIIFFPRGVTRTTGGLNLAALSSRQGSYIICGEGSGSKWKPTYFADSTLNVTNVSAVTVRDMAIIGQDSGGGSTGSVETASAIIYASSVLNANFENVQFLGLSTSVNADNYGLVAVANGFLSFKKCLFGSCSAPNSAVVNGWGLQGFKMEECFFPDYHEMDGVYYNKTSVVGDTKHWVRIHVPPTLNNANYSTSYATILDSRFDENTSNSLVFISGSDRHTAVLERNSFNGGYLQKPCMKLSDLKYLRMEDNWVGYDSQPAAYDSTIITNVNTVRIDNFTHQPPNGAANIQLLGTTTKLIHNNLSNVGITNTAGATVTQLY